VIPALLRLLRRLVSPLRTAQYDDTLARELASHVAMLEEDHVRRGIARDEARRMARRRLGGVEQIKELHRDARSFRWIDDARRDAGYALRILRRTPLLAATIILSLAIGIGGNTAVFTVANALLFRAPAAVADADRLVDIGIPRGGGGFSPVSYPEFLDVQRRVATSAGLASVYASPRFPQALSVATPGRPAAPSRVFGHFVSPNYFDVLGLAPAAGGWFGADERARNVVVSDRFRRTWFGDALPVGQVVSVNGETFTITGVLPEGFQGSSLVASDLWLPLLTAPAVHVVDRRMLDQRGSDWLILGGRLKATAAMPAVNAELEAIGRDLDREHPSDSPGTGLRAVPSSLVPGNRAMTAVLLSILMGLMSLVLLVACANVSGVLLARADARRHEIAVRLSIGAGRARLIRQLLMETVLLFALGSVAGIIVARVLVNLLLGALPALPVPFAISLPLDLRVMAFTIVLSLVAALLSGLTPALRTSKAPPASALKAESSGVSSRNRLRSVFVIGQAAISVALVFAAAIFTRAIVRAVSADPGYEPRGVEIVSVDLSMARSDGIANQAFWRTLLERVRHVPGVESASLARALPGGFETWGIGVGLPGRSVGDQLSEFEPDGNIVEPGYFRTMRIPIVAGRDFTDADLIGTTAVVIVGEAAARHYWPGQAAIGQFLTESTPEGQRALQVVGVVGDVRSSTLVDGVALSTIYVPQQQQVPSFLTSKLTVVARAAPGPGIAGAIRTLVTSMNPNLPISTSETLRESAELGLLPQRIVASVSGSLGLISAVLAGVGIYGISAFAVSRRTREFGIRMALGATRGEILRMVLRQGVVLAIAGAAIGLALGAGAAQILAGFLFGVPPFDPLVLIATATLFIGIGAAACYGPARRATNVDPLVALRRE
jgi:predicted permease